MGGGHSARSPPPLPIINVLALAVSGSLRSDRVADVVSGAPGEEASADADTVRNAVMNFGEDEFSPLPRQPQGYHLHLLSIPKGVDIARGGLPLCQ